MNKPTYERWKIRPTANELKSQWVGLHNGKHYLLPVVARHQKIVPKFDDGGNVVLDVQQPDPELAPLIEGFFDLVSTFNSVEKSIVFASEGVYLGFFGLVRKLLLVNYDFDGDDLTDLLTVNNEQLRYLFEAILKHLLRT
jgi:hypothetical protein